MDVVMERFGTLELTTFSPFFLPVVRRPDPHVVPR